MTELFFTIKTKDSVSVEAVLNKKKSVEFGGLNVLADSLELGQIVFIVFGGDKPSWETGLVGIGRLSKLPYAYEGRNFKVQVDIEILLTKPLKRSDFVLYPDTYDIIGIAPITKWEPNQALSQIQNEKAYALLNAIFNIDCKKQSEFETFFSTEQLLKIKDNSYRRYTELNPKKENTKKKKMVSSNPISFKLNHFDKYNNSLNSRYILSLLAKPFVILSGNSGTGKTRIALRFSKYLEKQTDTGINNTLLIPVGADWTDNTKILGYFNPLANEGKGEYVKSDILTFLELANENPSIPFFLILDEMNLSHVERYFSDFLSAMESGKPILLYKKPENCECAVPEKITLPENLFITGTVNIDETTYMFSPKVLDRANVIEFKPDKNDVLENLISDSSSDKEETAEPGVAEGFMELANKIRSGIIPDGLKAELEKLKSVLKSIYEILEKSGFEFAYRTAKEIRLYVVASYETCEDKSQFNINSVIDQQIVQKILPKIHGNKKQIGNLLSELKDELEKQEGFELSRAKVSSMIDKLDKYQYASFI